MVNANLGPSQDLAARLAKLERQVAALSSENTLNNASANERDGTPGVAIYSDANGGTQLRVNHTEGALGADGQHPAAMKVGEYFNPAGGSVGTGLGALRPDTSTAFYVGRLFVGANPVIAVFDDYGGAATTASPGNIVFGTDATANWGLSDPWLPLGSSYSTGVGGAGWQGTTAAAWTGLWDCFFILQHPKIGYNLVYSVPSGVTGAFRITCGPAFGALTQIDTWTGTNTTTFRTEGMPANGQGSVYGAPLAVPGAVASSYGTLWQIHVDAEVTAGAGTIQVAQPNFVGRQS